METPDGASSSRTLGPPLYVRHDRPVPTPNELRLVAHDAVLRGLPAGVSLAGIEAEVGKSKVRGVYSPDVAMYELVFAALDVAGVGQSTPISTENWRERFLPQLRFRNRHAEVNRLVYAFQTAVTYRSGLRPSVLDDTYGWFDVPIWPYATRAAVMTLRALSEGGDVAAMCAQVSEVVPQLEA